MTVRSKSIIKHLDTFEFLKSTKLAITAMLVFDKLQTKCQQFILCLLMEKEINCLF